MPMSKPFDNVQNMLPMNGNSGMQPHMGVQSIQDNVSNVGGHNVQNMMQMAGQSGPRDQNVQDMMGMQGAQDMYGRRGDDLILAMVPMQAVQQMSSQQGQCMPVQAVQQMNSQQGAVSWGNPQEGAMPVPMNSMQQPQPAGAMPVPINGMQQPQPAGAMPMQVPMNGMQQQPPAGAMP